MSLRKGTWHTALHAVSVVVILGLTWSIFTKPMSETESKYPFLARRIFHDNPNDIIINFTELRQQIREYIQQQANIQIGVYFEYLPTGTVVDVQGRDEFYRASLIKLPFVMRAYKYIEAGELSLDDELTIEDKQINRDFGELWKRGVGTKISIRDLIKLILDDSDNTAFNVLYEKVNVQLRKDAPSGDKTTDDVYDYLDIPRAETGITPMISPKHYASILKSLFFSAYLSYKHSNEILSIMTGSHPEHWLRNPIPDTIRVANKIGVYTAEPENNHVYADCGIVYYPSRPYSLCIMVKSNNGALAVPHLQHISKLVYEFIAHRP